jgi:3,4-dihydroxy 2-butanone 4-phosphate synthase/GTP cyclohydrolase II
VDANLHLGFPADLRDYWEAAQILHFWGCTAVRLLTNNPEKVSGLSAYDIQVVERIPLRVGGNPHNIRYMETKRERLGHLL